LFYAMLAAWLIFSRATSPTFAVGPFELLINLLLLFGLVPGREGSLVSAGWSIGVEVLFYIVFPVCAALLTTPLAAAAAFCVFTVVSSLTYNMLVSLRVGSYAYANLLTQLPYFLAGVTAYLLWRRDRFRLRPLAGALLQAGVAAAALVMVYVPSVYASLASSSIIKAVPLVWAFLFAVLILATCYAPNPIIVNPVTRYLGTISFSLYLVHPLVIVLSKGPNHVIDDALDHGALALAARAAFTLALVIAVSSLTYRFIEKPGIELGKRLTSDRRRGTLAVSPAEPATLPVRSTE
jgi:peptidoglycan/LPS O-acetylase OafA/YrhL